CQVSGDAAKAAAQLTTMTLSRHPFALKTPSQERQSSCRSPLSPNTISEPRFVLIRKGLRSLVKEGLKTATLKALRRMRRLYRSYRVKKSYAGSLEDRFAVLYKTCYWGGDKQNESFSGPGSTLEYTQVLRRELPKLFEQFAIRSVFDAPCGDFKWMKHV